MWMIWRIVGKKGREKGTTMTMTLRCFSVITNATIVKSHCRKLVWQSNNTLPHDMWQRNINIYLKSELVFIPIIIKMHTQVSYIANILYDIICSVY